MRKILLWLLMFVGGVSLVALFFIKGGATPIWTAAARVSSEAQAAAIFFVTSITSAQIQNNYRGTEATDPATGAWYAAGRSAKKVRILIVPGHQPSVGGTAFGSVWERDVVVDIADALYALLAKNPHYDVMVARTKTEWNPILQNYFDTHALEIDTFRQSQALQMASHLVDGSILPEADQIYHNDTPLPAALQLYGINKWTSDNGYDIVLHLHINDYPEHRTSVAGKYDGFVIYVPDHQYSNAEASKVIAHAIAVRLNAYHATSTLPQEDRGVVEDQELIATGSNNSANAAALLIEYGYIYEPQFQEPSVLSAAVADYAYETYLGLQDFFKDPVATTYGSNAFPYDWATVLTKTKARGAGVYALQSALRYLGYYPPKGQSFTDCPVSGLVGACTRSAIEAYQRAHNLDATGALGPQTRAALTKDLATP